MHRSLYVAFALVLMVATTQARADMVTYTMTGTILQTWHPFNSYTSA